MIGFGRNKALRLPLLITLLIALMCAFANSAAAQTVDQDTFTVASQLYANGSYEEAEALFQQLVDAGFDDGNLYYNLGNAHYKQSEYGEAILNYRRALLVTPRNRDLRANLELARERVVDQFTRSDVSLFESVTQLSNWLTLSEMATISLLLWFGVAGVRLMYRRPRTERQRTALQSALIGLASLLLLFVVAGTYRYSQLQNRPPAVVVADEANILESPGDVGEPVFVLHSGAEVTVVEARGQWVKLTLPGDVLQGWVSAEEIARVSP